jgi:hypothetical protein
VTYPELVAIAEDCGLEILAEECPNGDFEALYENFYLTFKQENLSIDKQVLFQEYCRFLLRKR